MVISNYAKAILATPCTGRDHIRINFKTFRTWYLQIAKSELYPLHVPSRLRVRWHSGFPRNQIWQILWWGFSHNYLQKSIIIDIRSLLSTTPAMYRPVFRFVFLFFFFVGVLLLFVLFFARCSLVSVILIFRLRSCSFYRFLKLTAKFTPVWVAISSSAASMRSRSMFFRLWVVYWVWVVPLNNQHSHLRDSLSESRSLLINYGAHMIIKTA